MLDYNFNSASQTLLVINVELAVVAEPEVSDEIPIDCNEAGSNGGQPDHLGYCSTQF